MSADLLTHVDDRLSTARMSLDLRLRIHLLVAELLAAPRYASRCAAAARLVGVLDAELLLARDADASDPAEALALGVARKLVLQRGYVPAQELRAVRLAGFGAAGLLDIVGEVSGATLVAYAEKVSEEGEV